MIQQEAGDYKGSVHLCPALLMCGLTDQKSSGWKAVMTWWRCTAKVRVGVWQGP